MVGARRHVIGEQYQAGRQVPRKGEESGHLGCGQIIHGTLISRGRVVVVLVRAVAAPKEQDNLQAAAHERCAMATPEGGVGGWCLCRRRHSRQDQ